MSGTRDLHIFMCETSGETKLRCSGRLALGVSIGPLREALFSTISSRVSVDLSRVHSVDAFGLGALIELHQLANALGKTLLLTGINQRIGKLLRITRLDSVLRIADNNNAPGSTTRTCAGSNTSLLVG